MVEDIYTSLQTAYENGYMTIGVADKASEPTVEQKKKYSHIYVESLKELIK